ncbi:DUF2680 domain-containing protein [Dehalobacter restrictus]|uniref:DUF2680 domain-containing protein n=1 Tax=Dehalobacter restrictus (strain DSM 9455 / PER-K23) TaxID=871738 RepID=A0ABN4BP24_DEHRP|nr:DUF2680 domain-containing protein [Dehalobacter restrictus]AHF08735.1 hypothetical protein DEHRE_00135 [Dehalobacter restrictus DSM 9455]
MKNVKKLIALVTVVGVLGVSGAAYAADIKTPAELAAALTGKSLTEVTQERAEGKTYGAIALEAGKLDEFKDQMLEQKKAVLDQRVKDGTLTQQQADQILTRIENNQAVCDGTGSAGIGRGAGAGFGQGKGMGSGRGSGTGSCNGSGFGGGMGLGRI